MFEVEAGIGYIVSEKTVRRGEPNKQSKRAGVPVRSMFGNG